MNILRGNVWRHVADAAGELVQMGIYGLIAGAFTALVLVGAIWFVIVLLRLAIDIVGAPFGLSPPF